jgi:hypothetical protein
LAHDVETARCDGSARRGRWRGGGVRAGMGALGRPEARHVLGRNWRGYNIPKVGAFSPLPGRAQRLSHGRARVGVHGGGKKQGVPVGGVQRHARGQRRDHTRNPKGSAFTLRVCALCQPRGKSRGGTTSGSTTSVQGRTGPKARPSPSGRACGGARARWWALKHARAHRCHGHGGV